MELKILELLIIALLWTRAISADYVVNLQNGTIVGMKMESRIGKEFAAFRGVPYALPPIGPWRFEPPQPSPGWPRIRYTKYDGKKCLHQNVYYHKEYMEGDEDCLYLNIYTPKVIYDSNEPTPDYLVMVFFHGGGWSSGSSTSREHGPDFLLDHDLVLVTVNYRLGPFGFLSTGDSVIPGNMGLKDQVQALRWVQENIALFGGNPNSVTIFGSGVGGASVHYLMISPLARGLFHRAISQSGTVANPWALNTREMAARVTKRLAKDVKCPIKKSEDMLQCLKQVNAKKLVTAYLEWPVFDLDPVMPFRPVIESEAPGAFLIAELDDLDPTKDIARVPWMVGLNSHEGALRVASIYGQKQKQLVQQLHKNFELYAPLSLAFENNCPQQMLNRVSRKIRKFYLGNKPINEKTKTAVLNMYSDALFNVGVTRAIREHSSTTEPIYYYHLMHQGGLSYTKHYGDRFDKYGVAHGDEIQYLFPVNYKMFPTAEFTDEDIEMVETMTAMWFNFARTGNPIPEKTDLLTTNWTPVTSDSLEHLVIAGPRNLTMSKDAFKDRLQFWENLPCHAGLAPSEHYAVLQDEL